LQIAKHFNKTRKNHDKAKNLEHIQRRKLKVHLAKSYLLKVVVERLKLSKAKRLRSLKLKKLKLLKVERPKSLKVVAKALKESNVQKYNMKNEDRNIMGRMKTKT
jgi:hypothetical protein